MTILVTGIHRNTGHSGRPDMDFINLGCILEPLGSLFNQSGHKFVIFDAEMGDGIRCQLFIACAAQIDILRFTGDWLDWQDLQDWQDWQTAGQKGSRCQILQFQRPRAL